MCWICSLFVVIWLILSAPRLQADSISYSLTDLGPANESNQGQVNNQGQVIFSSGSDSILYSGTRQSIPNPPGAAFTASWLNDLGQVVGTVRYPNVTYAVGLYAGGTVQIISSGANRTGDLINDAGQIVGENLDTRQPFLYFGGTYTNIGALPGDGQAVARGISDAGVLIDSTAASGPHHAAIYSHGVLIRVSGSEALNIQPFGMNDMGQVVGSATDTAHPQDEAILLSNGQAIFLGSLPGTSSAALAINDSGIVVGDGRGISTGFIATAYFPGTGWVNLNSVVSNAGGWSLEFAHSINNEGQIAGIGIHNGVPSAYLLTPVPEPSTGALLLIALWGLVAWTRRSRPR